MRKYIVSNILWRVLRIPTCISINLCKSIHIYVYTHESVNVYIHTCINIHLYTHRHRTWRDFGGIPAPRYENIEYIHTRIYIYTYTYIYICIYLRALHISAIAVAVICAYIYIYTQLSKAGVGLPCTGRKNVSHETFIYQMRSLCMYAKPYSSGKTV